jgi:cation diffusion facilitator family transporter
MDHRNDCLLTSLTLISCILSKCNVPYVDGIIGIAISLWILHTAVDIFFESYDVLMDKAISETDKKKVLAIIDKYPEIKKIQHFNSTPVGYKYQISFTIFVDGKLSTHESHEIADKLEDEIIHNIDEVYLCVIHVNPL